MIPLFKCRRCSSHWLCSWISVFQNVRTSLIFLNCACTHPHTQNYNSILITLLWKVSDCSPMPLPCEISVSRPLICIQLVPASLSSQQTANSWKAGPGVSSIMHEQSNLLTLSLPLTVTTAFSARAEGCIQTETHLTLESQLSATTTGPCPGSVLSPFRFKHRAATWMPRLSHPPPSPHPHPSDCNSSY